MQYLLYNGVLLLMLPLGVYFYYTCRRILKLLHWKISYVRVLSLVFSIIMVYFAVPTYSLSRVIVFHILAVSIFLDLLNLVLNKWWLHKQNKRWNFIYQSGILVAVITLGIFGYGYYNMLDVTRTEYEIHSEKISTGEEMKIAVMSDLHLGTSMNADGLERWCKEIQEEQAELLLLAGDIFDESTTREDMERAAAILGSVKCTYGVYYVFGNHDYNRYTYTPNYSEDDLREVLEKNQITVLEDQVAEPEGKFYIIGRQDKSVGNRKTITELLKGLDMSKLVILLDHQPVELEENNQAGIDLQFSGHTHAGQIWPSGQLTEFLGINEINYGYRQFDHLQVIVSSGMAAWGYPIRTAGDSEYVIVQVSP